MTYKTIHTSYGLTRMAQAEAAGVAINLVAMAVGDGGGNATTPDPSQTGLVRELFRAAPNRVYQDPTNPQLFTVELVIPATVGGFTVREAGAFDDQGKLFAVCNTPAAYKPLGDGSEGSFGDTVLRMQFLATNASVVTLAIDPNVAVATQSWITSNITVPYLLPGGTTGQVLAKQSNADGDTHWTDPTVANVVVSVVEEVQTLAASQTAVILTECTTFGLAIYIGGQRLLPTAWTADPVDKTKLTLAASYPAGTKVDFVQNEPAAWVPTPLVQQQNLADLPNKTTARANLGVYSTADVDARSYHPGDIFYTACAAAPGRSLKANGAAVSRTAYAALYAAIGVTFGAGDGFNTFNLPDLRGEFVRGLDDGRGVDANRAIGSAQAHAYGSHTHNASSDSQGSHTHTASTDTQGSHSHGGSTSTIGDHQHVTPFGESGMALPWGTYATGQQGSHGGTDADNPWPLDSPAGAHAHSIGTDVQGSHAHNVAIAAAGAHAHNIAVALSGSSETRPRNVALLACIAY